MLKNTQPFNTRQHMLVQSYEIYRYSDAHLDGVALHHHDFFEVYLFINGNVDYTIESHNFRLQSGDLLLINPTELHQPRITQEKQPYERMVLWLNKSFVEQFCSKRTDLTRCFDNTAPGYTNLLRLAPHQFEQVLGLMEALVEENHGETFGNDIAGFGLLLQLMVEVNRMALDAPQNHEIVDKSSGLMVQVLKHINEHYDEDISLDSLADQFFVSKYHLSHEFKRLVGTSVYSYIIKRRLTVAKQLLIDGMSPTSVYQHCGFGDYANFYRAFKAEYNINPKKYTDDARRLHTL